MVAFSPTSLFAGLATLTLLLLPLHQSSTNPVKKYAQLCELYLLLKSKARERKFAILISTGPVAPFLRSDSFVAVINTTQGNSRNARN